MPCICAICGLPTIHRYSALDRVSAVDVDGRRHAVQMYVCQYVEYRVLRCIHNKLIF